MQEIRVESGLSIAAALCYIDVSESAAVGGRPKARQIQSVNFGTS
jgi:hypothetical protein